MFRNSLGAWAAACVVAFGFASAMPAAAESDTVNKIKERGKLACGVGQGQRYGFSAPNDQGRWEGMDADYCRVVAAAILGDAEAVNFVPLSAKQRFPALQSGEIDLLVRVTTWTLSRDTTVGLQFAGLNFFTGITFMVNKELGVSSALELDGASICVAPGSTQERVVSDFFSANNIQYTPIVIENQNEINEAYLSGRCDGIIGFTPGNAIIRAYSAENPEDHVILPENLAKEPLGPVVRQGDVEYYDIVNWAGFALLEAEELGVTSENVDEMRNSDDPKIRRLLGVDPGVGEKLGLRETWAYDVIKNVGNYAEVFDRNLGDGSKLKLDRGLNRLWNDGGLLWAPPFG